MATALLAQRLGQRVVFDDPATLFTSALMHDVGKLALSEFVGKGFAKIEELVAQGESFVAAERQVLGVDHALLGAALAKQWNFPEPIMTAIAFHHSPERAPQHVQLTHLVALANLLCVSLGVGSGAEGLAAPAPASLLKEVGLKTRDLDLLFLELKDILDEAGDLLALAG
jgi:putative nucleotidyltransferase with HDIG domain